MEALLYANLTRETLAESATSQGNFAWPELDAGDTIDLALRFLKRVDGRNVLRDLTIRDLYAVIGRPGNTASTGSFKLHIGDEAASDGYNVTAAIVAGASAATWAAAINALSEVGEGETFGTATVTAEHGSMIIVFDGQEEAVQIRVRDNILAPRSLVRVVAYQTGGGVWRQDARILEAPLAFTDASERVVPPAPYIEDERFQAGGEFEGVALNEIQIFKRPTEFNSIWQFSRNNLKSRALSRADGVDEIKSALDDALADEDGEFLVTLVDDDTVFIEFAGSMAGTAQDLLGIVTPLDPPGDVAFSLDLSHPELYAALAEKDLPEVELQIRVVYEAEHDSDIVRVWSYHGKVKLKRPVHFDGLSTQAQIDYLNPPHASYVPPPSGPVITGSQHAVENFPTSGDVGASQFTLTHDLGTKDLHLAVRRNAEPALFLVHGTDYRLEAMNDDQVRITLLPGGYFADPVVNAGDTSKFSLAAGGTIDALGALTMIVTTAGPQTAVIAHNQAISSITNLSDILAAMQAEIDALTAQSGSGIPFQAVQSGLAGPLTRPLGIVWRVPRARALPERPATLLDWRITEQDLGVGPTSRPIRLQPAVHDAVVSALPATLPNPATTKGSVWSVTTARADLGGLQIGDYVASSGLELYRVVHRTGTSSYYPAAFEVTLFETAINPLEFPVKSTLQMVCGIELVMIALAAKARDRRSACQWSLILEAGVPTADASPGTPGGNLAAAFATPVTLLDQRLILTEIPIACRFGCKIVRDGEGALTARWIYNGRDGEIETPPSAVPFALRARLAWFDAENLPADPRGIVAARGLDVGIDGQADPNLGKLIIT